MPLSSSIPFGVKSPSELQEIARKELNEDPKLTEQSIQIIRDWIKQQPHLKSRTETTSSMAYMKSRCFERKGESIIFARDWIDPEQDLGERKENIKNDAFILCFLRACNFSIERTKERIDGFHTIRTAVPEWYTKRDILDPQIMELLNNGNICVLPGYDRQGRRTLLFRLAKFDPYKVNIHKLIKMDQIIIDYLVEDEQTQICGFNFVPDVSGCTGAHLSCFTPSIVKKYCMIWQEFQPIRVLSININREFPIFQALLSLFKMFLNENLKKAITLHGKNLKTLHEAVAPEILPEEYGGTAGKFQDMAERFKQELLKHRERFIEEEQYGVDESKRPGKPRTKQDLFGVDGSFRKLNID